MYCTQDCTCSLCRELRGFKPKLLGSKVKSEARKSCNDNFILRRRMSDFDDHHDAAKALPQQKHAKCSNSNSSSASGPNVLTKASSCNELSRRIDHQKRSENALKKIDQHKVIIYFGDSISNKRSVPVQNHRSSADDVTDTVSNVRVTVNPTRSPQPNTATKEGPPMPKSDFIRQLKTVLDEKNRNSTTTEAVAMSKIEVPTPPPPPPILPNEEVFRTSSPLKPLRCDIGVGTPRVVDKNSLPEFVDSIVDGVINIKIEDNFERASSLVRAISAVDKTVEEEFYISNVESFDWSFVQDWRSRYFISPNLAQYTEYSNPLILS